MPVAPIIDSSRSIDRGWRAGRWGLAAVLFLIGASCSTSSETESSPVAFDALTVILDVGGEASVVGNVTGAVEQVTIEWGDGAVDSVASGFPGVRASHRYEEDATYSIIVAAADGDGATINRVLTAEVSGASPTTTTTTSTTTTTTAAPTTTTPSTTTPSTTTPSTTTPSTTTPSTTTTTSPAEPITFDITRATGGGGELEGRTRLPFRVNVASWWRVGNLHARAAVGVGASAETPWAEAWLYSDFTAQREQATVRYTVSWDGSITVLASAGSAAAATIAVSVYELNGSTQGARVTREVVLDEELSSEDIRFVTTLEYQDSLTSSLSFPVESGKRYRVRLDLRCEARAAFALGATACTFGTNEVVDEGPYARWRNVTVTLD
jgi:hypothetical protein